MAQQAMTMRGPISKSPASSNSYPPFAERFLIGSFQPPIPHQAVRRIAFEGGGGKGNAYLGALYALDQLGILKQLDTVAGSSAGAITALTLSLGMRPPEVSHFMASTDFTKFFDEASDVIPAAGKPYEKPADSTKRMLATAEWERQTLPAHLLGLVIKHLRLKPSQWNARHLLTLLEGLFLRPDIRLALTALGLGPFDYRPLSPSKSPPPKSPPVAAEVLNQILASLPSHLTSLSLDMGIFSGETARNRFAALIAERMGLAAGLGSSVNFARLVELGLPVTFKQLNQFCKEQEDKYSNEGLKYPRLRITGSELCTLRTVIFSAEHTPDFPVADAVRISMGMPFAYKPYTIRSTGDDLPPCGVYVDGGVFSNLPLLAFSDKEASGAIGLRLEVDFPTRIDGFLGFLGQIANASLLAGESDVVGERAERSIRLDTEPLGRLSFKIDYDTLVTVSRRAYLTTMLFFGQGASYRPVDLRTGAPLPQKEVASDKAAAWMDLKESVKRRREASSCVFSSKNPS